MVAPRLSAIVAGSQEVGVIVRSFQRGANNESFDKNMFDAAVKSSISNVISSRHVHTLVVVTPGDGGKFSEVVTDDQTPTGAAIKAAFPTDVKSGRIITHVMKKDWGHNPGSTTALNEGLDIVARRGLPYVLCWSPELRATTAHVSRLLTYMKKHDVAVCGLTRQRWWERAQQWGTFQNTGALWSVQRLKAIDGFDVSCDGDGVTTVQTEYGPAPLAGMEDFHAFLRMLVTFGKEVRWGQICRRDPIEWRRSHIKPGSERFGEFMTKISRQAYVMEAYAKRVFPNDDPHEVIEFFFSLGSDDGNDRP